MFSMNGGGVRRKGRLSLKTFGLGCDLPPDQKMGTRHISNSERL
jgi:hypothetical protein